MTKPKRFRFLTRGSLPGDAPPLGLYHYVREADGRIARFHLRVDATGDGLLMANAAAMARLNASGVVIAKGLLDGDDPAVIAARMKKGFRGAKAEQIAADIATVETLIKRMESPDGSYPILNLTDPAFSPTAAPLGRPISADVPLCAPFHIGRIFERLWQLGIPHATIIAGQDPDEEYLIRAIEKAEDLGIITGVRGRGTDLDLPARVATMAGAGLDHLDIYCLSTQDPIHDALVGDGDCKQAIQTLSTARKNEICAVAQVVLVQSTLEVIDQTLESLASHGIENVCVFAIAATDDAGASTGALLARELAPAARWVEESSEELGLRLVWCPTVRFDPNSTLGEQVCRGPRTSGDGAIRIEPNGSVILPRGPRRPAGNLLEDDWETIERSEMFQKYRQRVETDTHCDQCPGLAICAADCPRDPTGWAESG